MDKRLFCLALVNLLVFASASGQWTQTNGPEGGEAKCLVVFNNTLFVGTAIGVFLSTDNGAHWSPTGLKNTDAVSLAIRPLGGTNMCLFAGTWRGGVHRSTDYGTSWQQVNFGLSDRGVKALAVMGTNLFAGTDSGGVFLSPSDGDYWIPASEGLANTCINTLAVVDTDIYAGTQSGLLRSTDKGTSWAVVGLTSESVRAFAVLDTSFFAGTDTNGVMRSTDRGKSWTKISNPDMGRNVRALAVAGATLYAATDLGFFRTPNHGAYWIPSNTGVVNTSALSLLVNGPDLYGGTYGGVFRSTNGGTSWAGANVGLKTTVVFSLAVMGADLYAGSLNGFFRSSTGGNTWASPGPNAWICSIAINGTEICTGSWGHVISSLNSGASWDWFPLSASANRVLSLATCGTEVLAGTESAGVFRFKHNAPGSCTVTTTALMDTTVHALAVRGTDVFAGTDGGIFHSTNSGKDWMFASSGLTNVDVRAVAVNGPAIFAGTAAGDVFRSTDNGGNWIAASSGLKGWGVLSFAVSGNNIFAGTWQGGVFLSTNNGGSWIDVNTGPMTSMLEPSSIVHALAVVGSYLYAGTRGAAVWKRPLSEMVSSVGPRADELPQEYELQQNHPNPFNPSTTIRYGLPQRSHVSLAVYNSLGQQVTVLQNGEQEAGYHEVTFDASSLPSGVYFYRLQAGSPSIPRPLDRLGARDSEPRATSSGYMETKKLLLVR